MQLRPTSKRHVAASAALQWHLNLDPDTALHIAERVLFHADRAGIRQTIDGMPSDDEVTRAANALARRGIDLARDDVYAALYAALTLGEFASEDGDARREALDSDAAGSD